MATPKFKLRKGWTKQKMLKVLLTRNNGKPAQSSDHGVCVYANAEGNHCAVGCFIPDGHPGMELRGTVGDLLASFPTLQKKMPIGLEGLKALQAVHDHFDSRGSAPYSAPALDVFAQEPKTLHDAFRLFVDQWTVKPKKVSHA
jgi:hypothetical protein